MECRPIDNLTFDRNSQQALKDIERFKRNGEVLTKFLAAGTIGNIFVGAKPLHAAYNIAMTDWEKFQQAMETIPALVQRSIDQTAFLQTMKHPAGSPEHEFWNNVYAGCDV